MKLRPGRGTIASLAVATLVAGVVATSWASGGHTSAKPAKVIHGPVSPRLLHLIGALSRAHRASGPVPAAVLSGTEQQVGINPSAAVFAGGKDPTWIVPGSTEVCLLRADGGICGTIASFEQHGLVETSGSSPGSAVVFGLVPNGNTSVVVTNSDGSTETEPVNDNVYEITNGHPVSAMIRNASGVKTSVHLPVLSSPPPSEPAG